MKNLLTGITLLITISAYSQTTTKVRIPKTDYVFEYSKPNINADSTSLSKREIPGLGEVGCTVYSVDENFGITIFDIPKLQFKFMTAPVLIDSLLNQTVTTWRNNSTGVQFLGAECGYPCKDLVFTFVLEGTYYYSRALVLNGKLIELMAIYDDPMRYHEFKKVFDSFRLEKHNKKK